MSTAAENILDLKNVIASIGFNEEDLKTTSFNINIDYYSRKDKDNNYIREFNGYICDQRIKLEFDFDSKRLFEVLGVIAVCLVEPDLNISFSVKDKSAVNEQLLIGATKNAREKAEILTNASCVNLGDIISIDYNWGELQLYSPTRYSMEDKCMAMESSYAPDIEPEDIDVRDSVTFVWEII